MKKIRWTILMIISFLIVSGCSTVPDVPPRLSDERMQQLRKEYPFSTGYPSNIQMRDVPFDEILDYSDAVIIAEVLQRDADFKVDLTAEPGTPEADLKEKERQQGGEPYQPTFVSYNVNVRETIVGEKVEGHVQLFFNSDFKGVEPDLKPGMNIVVSVKKGTAPAQQGKYSFTRYATYYIVDENYVLSAFQGQTDEMKTFTEQTDGRTLAHLVEIIKECW